MNKLSFNFSEASHPGPYYPLGIVGMCQGPQRIGASGRFAGIVEGFNPPLQGTRSIKYDHRLPTLHVQITDRPPLKMFTNRPPIGPHKDCRLFFTGSTGWLTVDPKVS
jgi:hypothetical protein